MKDLPEQAAAVSRVLTPEAKSRAVSQSADVHWRKEVREAPQGPRPMRTLLLSKNIKNSLPQRGIIVSRRLSFYS